MENAKLLTTKGSDEWYTPKYILDYVKKIFEGEIEIDPCSNGITKIGSKINLTKEDNGLGHKGWDSGNIFINPPYSMNKEFAKRVLNELKSCYNLQNNYIKKQNMAYLCHANTDTKWFTDLVNSKYCYKVVFIKGRVKFMKNVDGEIVSGESATKGSCLIFLKWRNTRIRKTTFERIK